MHPKSMAYRFGLQSIEWWNSVSILINHRVP